MFSCKYNVCIMLTLNFIWLKSSPLIFFQSKELILFKCIDLWRITNLSTTLYISSPPKIDFGILKTTPRKLGNLCIHIIEFQNSWPETSRISRVWWNKHSLLNTSIHNLIRPLGLQNDDRAGHMDLGGSSRDRSPAVRGCRCFYYPQSTVSNIYTDIDIWYISYNES